MLPKGIPYDTTLSAARAAVGAIADLRAARPPSARCRSTRVAKFPMTPRGQQALRDELKRLREVERPKNVRDIEVARAHGDCRRRTPSTTPPRSRQGLIEGAHRATSESIWIARAEVIDRVQGGRRQGRVRRDRRSRSRRPRAAKQVTYTIVGEPRGRHQGEPHRDLRPWRAP